MSASTESERREAYIRALLREREGLLRQGKLDRVAEIDAQLGGAVARAETPVKRAEKRPKTQRGQTR